MSDGAGKTISEALARAAGSPGDSDELLELLYEELRDTARRLMLKERPGQTLQATALVHEAWLRVSGNRAAEWDNRRHFFVAAATAMRRILIEQARRKQRRSDVSGGAQVDLRDEDLAIESPGHDVLAVDELLQELEAADPRAREVVNLRYFAGLNNSEAAEVIGVSVATVERDWRFVRTYLQDALGRGIDSGDQE